MRKTLLIVTSQVDTVAVEGDVLMDKEQTMKD